MSDIDQISLPESRRIKGINTIGLATLLKKEIGRFLVVYTQTLVAPVITTLLFYTVFALAFGGMERDVGDVPFLEFLAPGLIMMSMVQNAFSNSSSSLIIGKIQGNIVDVLMPPLSSMELLLGFAIGALVRGLLLGIISVFIISLFIDLTIESLWVVVVFALLGNFFMGVMGVLAGITAEKFDHIAAFTNFFVTPMTFLSGTFYSLDSLPETWRVIGYYNPFFYMIDGFRSGFIGQADGNIYFGMGLLLVCNIALFALAYRMLVTGYKIKS